MISQVALIKIKANGPHQPALTSSHVKGAVRDAMRLAGWQKYINGKRIFLKVNCLSSEVVPGQCTSPWVFEGVLEELKSGRDGLEVFFGDADVAATRQLDKAVRNWGIKEAGERYGAKFINLSRSASEKVYMGKVLGSVSIPKAVLDVDEIVTIPIVKTHCITAFTGALKNQWGLLPRMRFQFHDVVNEAIAELNKFFERVKFAVADMTISQEGPGPRCGVPKVCDLVLASPDRVALDTVAATYMGFKPEDVRFITLSAGEGVGSMGYELRGDPLVVNPFRPGRGEEYFIYRWRDRFKRTPILKTLCFKEKTFRFLGAFATSYNHWVWHRMFGRGYARGICEKTWYKDEFKDLIK